MEHSHFIWYKTKTNKLNDLVPTQNAKVLVPKDYPPNSYPESGKKVGDGVSRWVGVVHNLHMCRVFFKLLSVAFLDPT